MSENEFDNSSDDQEPVENSGSDSEYKAEDYDDEIDSDESVDCDKNTERLGNGDKKPKDGASPTEESEYVGSIIAGVHRFDRKFVCVKYPGNVESAEKAIETLGGLAAISTAVDTKNRRLELRFRPDDGYCKPACGDRHSTSGFLLRVRVKRKRGSAKENLEKSDSRLSDSNLAEDCSYSNKTAETQSTDREVKNLLKELTNRVADCNLDGKKFKENLYLPFDKNKYKDLSKDYDYRIPEYQVLGQIDTEFRFMNLCDFQYLPITPKVDNRTENECVYEAIYPVNVPSYSWLKNKVPYFLPPAAFSRTDNVQLYVPKTRTDTLPENVIGKTRKRRSGYSNFINFQSIEVPTEAPKGIETAMRVKFLKNFHLERVKKFFEQRPIWSKNALMFETKFTSEQLKIMLPSVAYYFMTGPWRIMWVKLGYDPRKDPAARQYQTLDYRLKAMHGLESTVKCKRSYSNYILPYKLAPAAKSKTTILSSGLALDNVQKEKHFNKNVYVYKEGTVPPSRQMFYQYCDVHVDEIQEMLSKLPDPLPGTKCHEKLGWLPVGFDDQCREIINKQVRGVLRKRMNIPEDHPTTLPRKRKFVNRVKLTRSKVKRESKESRLINDDSSSIHMEIIPDCSDEEWEELKDTAKSIPGTSKQNDETITK